MKVTVKTAGYQGKVTKTVALKSDDPVRPDVTLSIRMVLVGSVILMPSDKLLLRYRRDQPATGSLLIRQDPTEAGTLSITGLASSEPWLKVRVRTVEGEESREGGFKAVPGDFILEADVPVSPGAGLHRAGVTFRTGLPREPVITIQVTVTARAFGSASTQRLLLQRETPDGLVKGQMIFRLLGETDPETVEVGITPDRYTAEVQVLNPGQLQVLVAEDPDKGNGEPLPDGMLKFTRGAETVSVPVHPSEP